MRIIDRTTGEIIDSDYKEFALYTLEARAIPSAIDGLKVVQRKLVYAMLKRGGKKTKVAEWGGSLASYGYDHGEASAMGAAVGLTAPWNNTEPLFIGHGSFGTRLVPQAASPRYIYAEMSDAFKKYFIDEEVAPVRANEDHPEPVNYLPIIPWVLINGVSGIAVGFKTEILPRSVKDILKATKDCLKNPEKFLKDNKPIAPTFPQFKGNVIYDADAEKYFTTGLVEYVGKYTYKINELPIGYDREKYIDHLENMIEKELIKDYTDNCSKSGFGFTVKVSLSQKTVIDKDQLKYFGLIKSHSEIYTTIGYDSKVKIFSSVAELIHYFVQYRLTKFEEKRLWDINEIEQRKNYLIGKKDFLVDVITVRLNVNQSTKAQMLNHALSHNTNNPDWASRYISTPVYAMTTDEVEKLNKEIQENVDKINALKNKTAQEIYETVL